MIRPLWEGVAYPFIPGEARTKNEEILVGTLGRGFKQLLGVGGGGRGAR